MYTGAQFSSWDNPRVPRVLSVSLENAGYLYHRQIPVMGIGQFITSIFNRFDCISLLFSIAKWISFTWNKLLLRWPRYRSLKYMHHNRQKHKTSMIYKMPFNHIFNKLYNIYWHWRIFMSDRLNILQPSKSCVKDYICIFKTSLSEPKTLPLLRLW